MRDIKAIIGIGWALGFVALWVHGSCFDVVFMLVVGVVLLYVFNPKLRG